MKTFMQFKKNIEDRALIQDGDTVVLGISGGSDSVALLFLLMELQEFMDIDVVLAHVNHHLRKDSSKDQALCEAYAAKFDLYIEVLDADPEAREESNVEAWARKTRYDFFHETAAKHGAKRIAVAHTKDDQAETVLMHFLKGAGLAGMSGMRNQEGKRIRPVLNFSKQELRDYLAEQGGDFHEDVTNQDTAFVRNKIRHELLPLMKEFNEGIVETLARSAEVWRDVEEYVHQEAGAFIEQNATYSPDTIEFPKDLFLALPSILQREVLQGCMQSFDIQEPLSFNHFEQVKAILENYGKGKTKELAPDLHVVLKHDVIRISYKEALSSEKD